MRTGFVEPEYDKLVKKPNRFRRLLPKTHQVVKESGRSLKDLWRRLVAKSHNI